MKKLCAFASVFGVMFALIIVAGPGFSKSSSTKCVAVYYDNSKVIESFTKLLSNFSDFQQFFIPLGQYEAGSLEKCQANFVINTEFDNQVSRKLVEDYLSSRRNVVWMGYNIWHLGEQLNKKLGLRYMGSISKVRDENCALLYRGHAVRCEESSLSMQPDLVPTNEVRIQIMAESRARGRELAPYIVRAGNLFYMADVSFGEVFRDLLTEFIGSPMRIKPLKSQQVAGSR
ncbi:hypothetical protein B9G69_014820 [Bdellovibrio sp. SKB1291214]|uniref:hypothetical protein n=1 Tax=Bdellovibrio sp. SKB1291214 TaxID=1732569 RepID=UPI000B51C57F|nr:hypothetical protein [Bdellovibrio sp. SKB1291214]UYL08312.1 hypothetical protein B9G69_014820 [Bdellovibrio sp. SKB1291214]